MPTDLDDTWHTTFRTEFLDRNLVSFEQCALAYLPMSLDELLAEMAHLISPRLRAVPFSSSGRRYYALMDALIRRTADSDVLNSRERVRLVNICIDFVEYARRQTPQANQADFDRALNATLDSVDLFGRYPQVAQLVADGTRDYEGGFTANQLGAILSAG